MLCAWLPAVCYTLFLCFLVPSVSQNLQLISCEGVNDYIKEGSTGTCLCRDTLATGIPVSWVSLDGGSVRQIQSSSNSNLSVSYQIGRTGQRYQCKTSNMTGPIYKPLLAYGPNAATLDQDNGQDFYNLCPNSKDLNITCDAGDSNPPPTYRISTNDTKCSSDTSVLSCRPDKGGTLSVTCVANNVRNGMTVTVSLELGIREPPKGPPTISVSSAARTVAGNNVTAVEGTDTISCKVNGGYPLDSSVTLVCDKGFQDSKKTELDVPVNRRMQGNCSCKASHPSQCYVKENSIHLNVHYQAEIMNFSANGKKSLDVTEHQEVTFVCRAEGNPAPVLMLQRGEPRREDMYNVANQDLSYTMTLHCNGTGLYTCSASNTVGAVPASQSVQVNVLCPPRLQANSTNQTKISGSFPLTHNVSVYGYPQPTRFTLRVQSTCDDQNSKQVIRGDEYDAQFIQDSQGFGNVEVSLYRPSEKGFENYFLYVENDRPGMLVYSFTVTSGDGAGCASSDNQAVVIAFPIVLIILIGAIVAVVVIIFVRRYRRDTDNRTSREISSPLPRNEVNNPENYADLMDTFYEPIENRPDTIANYERIRGGNPSGSNAEDGNKSPRKDQYVNVSPSPPNSISATPNPGPVRQGEGGRTTAKTNPGLYESVVCPKTAPGTEPPAPFDNHTMERPPPIFPKQGQGKCEASTTDEGSIYDVPRPGIPRICQDAQQGYVNMGVLSTNSVPDQTPPTQPNPSTTYCNIPLVSAGSVNDSVSHGPQRQLLGGQGTEPSVNLPEENPSSEYLNAEEIRTFAEKSRQDQISHSASSNTPRTGKASPTKLKKGSFKERGKSPRTLPKETSISSDNEIPSPQKDKKLLKQTSESESINSVSEENPKSGYVNMETLQNSAANSANTSDASNLKRQKSPPRMPGKIPASGNSEHPLQVPGRETTDDNDHQIPLAVPGKILASGHSQSVLPVSERTPFVYDNNQIPPAVPGKLPARENGKEPHAVPQKDPPAVPKNDPPAVPKKDPPAVPQKDSPAVSQTDPPAVSKKHLPAIPQKGPSAVPQKDPPAVPQKDPPAVSQKHPPAVPQKDPPAVSQKDPPAVSQKDPPAVSQKDPPAVSQKDPPAVSQKDPPAVSQKDPPAVSQKDPPAVSPQNLISSQGTNVPPPVSEKKTGPKNKGTQYANISLTPNGSKIPPPTSKKPTSPHKFAGSSVAHNHGPSPVSFKGPTATTPSSGSTGRLSPSVTVNSKPSKQSSSYANVSL